MATFTAGPGADTGIDFTQFDIKDSVKDDAGATFKGKNDAATEITFFGTPTSFDTFRGTFVVTGTIPNLDEVISGTINEFQQFDDNKSSVLLTGLSMSVAQFEGFLNAGNSQGFLAAAFAGDDTITGLDKTDNMLGFNGNDTMDGGAENDTLNGGAGNDSLIGGLGDDSLDGGAGNDTYNVDSLKDTIKDASGIDTVQSSVAFALGAGFENLTLVGSDNIDGTGNTLANVITGNEADNKLSGGDANDTVIGNGGADTLLGGAGNDSLDGGSGDDSMDGGAGNDSYAVDSAADKANETVAGPAGGTDTVFSSAPAYTLGDNIENLTLMNGSGDLDGTGNKLANVITGNDGNNDLAGDAGNDKLSGGKGDDSLSGGADNDTLDGGDGNDSLDGGKGNDSMIGGKGDDVYFVDSANDKVSETLTNPTGGTDLVNSSVSFTLGLYVDNLKLIDGFPGINGTGNADKNEITGNDGDNQLAGMAGDDMLFGKAGKDLLDGGIGADTMDGGADDDVYIQDNAGDQFNDSGITLGDELRTNQSTLTGALGNIEHYTFTGSKAVTFDGDGAANKITGTALADVFDGKAGNDTLNGLAGNDSLVGGLDNDRLDGGAGIDKMSGGTGDDTYVVDNAADIIDEAVGDANDTVESTLAVDLNLGKFAGIEHAMLLGAAAVNLTGDGDANKLTGNDGANKIDGGVGDDTMDGGKGADTYFIDKLTDQVAETLTIAQGGGIDSVFAKDSFELGANIDNLTLSAGIGDIDGTGNALANAITGNEGKNELAGDAGNDKLVGGAEADSLSGDADNDTLDGGDGSDILDGGTGIDSMAGGKGDDSYVVDNSKDIVSETVAAGGGDDTVVSSASFTLGANIEDLILTGDGANGAGTGNAGDNIITGTGLDHKLSGLGGNDTLSGLAGKDTLDGGIGNDSMIGDEGDDLYVVDSAGDSFDEKGTTLGDELRTNQLLTNVETNIEHYTFTGSKAVDFKGDGEANRITGTALTDKLDGAGGNDTLNGGAGADTMLGGKGDDIYFVDAAGDKADEFGGDGTDEVRSTVSFILGTGLDNLTLLGTGAINATGNNDKNVITGNDGANKLDGGLGDDTMDGGKGADTYFVDKSTDQVAETLAADKGGGIDTVFSAASFKLGANIDSLTLTGKEDFSATGNDLANILTGNDGNNTLDGKGGIDKMAGGKGDDLYIVDHGKDTVTETVAGLPIGGNDTVESSASFILGTNVENLVLTGLMNIDGTGNTLDNDLTGNDGNNKLLGLAGKDELIGNGGNDFLDGGIGDDTMTGGEGDDVYVVDSAGDKFTETGTTLGDELRTNQTLATVETNIEHYTFTGSKAVDFKGDGEANRITGTALGDKLDGAGGNDTLAGLAGNDSLVGGIGNDRLDGGAGIDKMSGDTGDDTYVVDNAADIIDETGGDANDTVESTLAIDLNLLKFAGIEHAMLLGAAAVNLTGDGNANKLTGNDGANKIDGGAGADSMAGGKGNDTFTADDLGDTVTEGLNAGTDLVLSSVDFKLGDNVENLTLQGDAVVGIGNDLANAIIGNGKDNELFGSDGKDTLTGNGGNDILDGGAGADSLIGSSGNDVYVVDNVGDKVSETLTNTFGGIDTVNSSISYTLGLNLDNLLLIDGAGNIDGTGNAANNELTGNEGANKLVGLAGNDKIDGGGGNDTLTGGAGNDSLVGGTGTDVAIFASKSTDYMITTIGGVTTVLDKNKAAGGDDGTDALTDVEFLQFSDTKVQIGVPITLGTPGDDTPTLTPGADGFDGLGGNDSLAGLGGGDLLLGGADNDTIDGGADNDTVSGGAGDDKIDGGLGTDSADFRPGATQGAVIDLSLGLATKDGQGGQDTLVGIENARGTDFADGITGDDKANLLQGVGGTDTITGGDGNDTADGGAGADEYRQAVGDGFDVVTNADGLDRVLLTGVDLYDLNFDRIGNDLVLAAAIDGDYDFADTGSITIKDHYLGSSIAFVQIDTLYNAIYGTDPNLTTAFFTTDLANGLNNTTAMEVLQGSANADVINGNGGFYDQLYGYDGNDTITSGSSSDFMAGGDGNDRMLGNAGDDRMRGNAGNDTLDGGAGIDRADYRRAAAGVTVDLSVGKATNDGDGGQDTMLNIENVGGSEFADKIAGNAGANLLFGRGGNDSIAGGGGGDDLQGQAGDDTLAGGTGDDNLEGGSGTDEFRHALGDGFDTVTDADGNDHVLLTGTDLYDLNFDRVGDDLIVSAAIDGDYDFADTGSLTIRDHYLGSSVAFVLIDTIYNEIYGTDPNLTKAVFTTDLANGLNNVGFMEIIQGSNAGEIINGNGGFYDQLYGAGGNDTITSGSSSDFVDGGSGDDSLVGGAGNDRLRGRTGNDTIDGGTGVDRARYDNASGGVIVDLVVGTAVQADGGGDSGTDKLISIEEVRGSAFADTLTGDGGENRLEGRGGDDSLSGGDGDDDLRGGDGNDTLLGGSGRDGLLGGAGNDLIDGSDLDSRDQVQYDTSPAGVVVNLTTGTAQDGFGGTDTLLNIQRVYGSLQNDKLTGDADIFANLLGSDGNDTIDGAGNGFASYFDSPAAVNANLATGTANDGWANTDKLSNLRGLSGSDFNDTLTGDGKDNWFEGAAGNDSISGGLGIDVVDYNFPPGGVIVDLGAGTATDNFGGTDKLAGIEDVWASNAADKLTGSAVDNLLFGAQGNDTLTGLAGADTFDFSLAASDGADVITDFSKSTDKLSFFDVVDVGTAGLDLDDLNAAITSVTDGVLGGSVTVAFNNGASIVFQGAGTGTGAVNSIDDLVTDPVTQIILS